ncbi:MAG: hypothetical protein AB2541_07555 [Candidatus Thiodiazotropha sp.]
MKICVEGLTDIMTDIPQEHQDRARLYNKICTYNQVLLKTYSDPLELICSGELPRAWLNILTEPAVSDLEGIVRYLTQIIIDERERRQSAALREYSLRWNLPVRMWRLAMIRQHLRQRFIKLEREIYGQLDSMLGHCENEYGQYPYDLIDVNDIAVRLVALVFLVGTEIDQDFEYL